MSESFDDAMSYLRDESPATHSALSGVTQTALDRRAAIRTARDRVVEAALEHHRVMRMQSVYGGVDRCRCEVCKAVRELNVLVSLSASALQAQAKEGA